MGGGVGGGVVGGGLGGIVGVVGGSLGGGVVGGGGLNFKRGVDNVVGSWRVVGGMRAGCSATEFKYFF